MSNTTSKNWPSIRLKYLADIKMGQSPLSSDYVSEGNGLPFLQGCAEFGEKFPSPKVYCLEPNKVAEEGDILFSVRAPVGDLNVANQVFGIGRGLCAIRAKKQLDDKFLWWVLHYVREQLRLVETGSTYAAVATEDVANLLIPEISLLNQKKIAGYLDRETAYIDALIEAKENLLMMLTEKRQVLITQTVTRGVNSDTPLKLSGIDWLGDVPEHWTLKKLKYVTTKIGSGVTPKGGSEVYQKVGIPFLRSQNIHFSGLQLDDVVYISEDVHQAMSGSQVEAGDVLLNITGASLGRCYYFEGELGEANVSQHVCILRPDKNILTKFLFYFLYSEIGQVQIQLSQTGGGREGLNFESLKAFTLPLPSIKEQQIIIDFVEKQFYDFNRLTVMSQQTITLLKERRSALITAAVTGQIDISEKYAHNETTNSRSSIH